MVLNHLVNHLVRNDKIQNTEKLCFAYLVSPWADWCHINMQPQVPGDLLPARSQGTSCHSNPGEAEYITYWWPFIVKVLPVRFVHYNNSYLNLCQCPIQKLSFFSSFTFSLLHTWAMSGPCLDHVWTMSGPCQGHFWATSNYI